MTSRASAFHSSRFLYPASVAMGGDSRAAEAVALEFGATP